MNIWLIVAFLLSGSALGFFRLLPQKFYFWIDKLSSGGLILLLSAMGAKIGVDDRILQQLASLGFKAFILALVSIIGSVFLLKLYVAGINLEAKVKKGKNSTTEEGESRSNHLMTALILGSVLGGILLGFFLLPPWTFLYLDRLTTYGLALLLFGVGIDIGLNKEALARCREMGWPIVLIPFIVAIGSLIGAVIIASFLGLSSQEATAVAAGFGWYSLSGILLSKLHSVELGSLAFLTNVFRELITIISLPLVVKYFGKITSIAPGGATTMDVTLPLIKNTAGEEIVIPAFISGVILSSLVPILVPLLIN